LALSDATQLARKNRLASDNVQRNYVKVPCRLALARAVFLVARAGPNDVQGTAWATSRAGFWLHIATRALHASPEGNRSGPTYGTRAQMLRCGVRGERPHACWRCGEPAPAVPLAETAHVSLGVWGCVDHAGVYRVCRVSVYAVNAPMHVAYAVSQRQRCHSRRPPMCPCGVVVCGVGWCLLVAALWWSCSGWRL